MNLPPVIGFQVLHDILNRLFEHIQTYRTFLACLDDPLAELVTVERLMPAIPFDDEKIGALNLLVGGEPVLAVSGRCADGESLSSDSPDVNQ